MLEKGSWQGERHREGPANWVEVAVYDPKLAPLRGLERVRLKASLRFVLLFSYLRRL